MKRKNKKGEEEFLAPDLTPLIDVVFILLIFFLVTSVFKKNELAMILKLPESSSAQKSIQDKKDYLVEMKDDAISFEGKIVTVKELQKILKNKDPKITVHLKSDKMTHYHKVIKVLDLLKINSFTNINLITRP